MKIVKRKLAREKKRKIIEKETSIFQTSFVREMQINLFYVPKLAND